MKKLLQSSRVLVHFDPSLPLIPSCDASPYGLGAVLSHKMPNGEERPVGFASRTLTATELKYSQLDKEALAIVFGVKKYHSYLYGRQFVLKTDHKPLTHIFKETRAIPTLASGRIQRWALILSAYSYTIQYKPGKENSNADALSRLTAPGSKKEPPKPPEVVHLMCGGQVSMRSLKSVLSLVRHVKSIGNPHQQHRCMRGPGPTSRGQGCT